MSLSCFRAKAEKERLEAERERAAAEAAAIDEERRRVEERLVTEEENRKEMQEEMLRQEAAAEVNHNFTGPLNQNHFRPRVYLGP